MPYSGLRKINDLKAGVTGNRLFKIARSIDWFAKFFVNLELHSELTIITKRFYKAFILFTRIQ